MTTVKIQMIIMIRISSPHLIPHHLQSHLHAINGPLLSEHVNGHCSVYFHGNGNVIGGMNKGISKNTVWVANPSTVFTFAQGPSLLDKQSGLRQSTLIYIERFRELY